MRKMSLLFSLLGAVVCVAQEEASPAKLKGVLLVNDSSRIKETDLSQINGVQFDGLLPTAGDLRDELAPFLSNYPITADGVKKLCEAVASHYRQAEDLRVIVTAPEQNATDGVVQLVVTPEKLGEVHIKNNRFTSPDVLRKWVRLSSADAINEKTIAQDLGWMNTNPFRSVKVEYQSGDKPGVTDVDLLVSDKKSWKLSSGVDNTGNQLIGPLRIFAGVDVNDFIFTDHTLSLKGTTADRYAEYQSYSLQYAAPLAWRHIVKLSGSYTGTFPAEWTGPSKQHRHSYQASGRYAVPHWFGANPWVDQLSFEGGVDFKGTNTNILQEGNPTPTEKRLAYVGQFAGGVYGERKREDNKITAGLDLVGSPAKMLPNQSDTDFSNLRTGATPQYLYSRLVFALDQKLPSDWKLFFQGRGQYSFSTLLPSEQLALGGFSTVRGYEEKIVNGDHAVCGNLEVRTPSFKAVGTWVPKFADSLYFLGFVDGGSAWFRTPVDGVADNQSLLGVGTGLRYSVASYFSSRLDFGFPLLKVEKDSGNARVHFNAVLSY